MEMGRSLDRGCALFAYSRRTLSSLCEDGAAKAAHAVCKTVVVQYRFLLSAYDFNYIFSLHNLSRRNIKKMLSPMITSLIFIIGYSRVYI